MRVDMQNEEVSRRNIVRFETVLTGVLDALESPRCLEVIMLGMPVTPCAFDVLTSRNVLRLTADKVEAQLHMAELTRLSRVGTYAVFDFERVRTCGGFDPRWIRSSMRGLGWVPTAQSDDEETGVTVVAFHRPFPDSVYFVTSNPMKLREMRSAVEHPHLHACDFDLPELKHDSIEKIADDKARRAYAIVGRPVLCTDGGIFMDAYEGFPGPNSKQAATKLKPEGLLRLLAGVENRNGSRRNAAAFFDGFQMSVEVSEVPVRFSEEPRGTFPSYPMDKILIPVTAANPAGLTYAEMPPEERGRTSEVPALARFLSRFASPE